MTGREYILNSYSSLKQGKERVLNLIELYITPVLLLLIRSLNELTRVTGFYFLLKKKKKKIKVDFLLLLLCVEDKKKKKKINFLLKCTPSRTTKLSEKA